MQRVFRFHLQLYPNQINLIRNNQNLRLKSELHCLLLLLQQRISLNHMLQRCISHDYDRYGYRALQIYRRSLNTYLVRFEMF